MLPKVNLLDLVFFLMLFPSFLSTSELGIGTSHNFISSLCHLNQASRTIVLLDFDYSSICARICTLFDYLVICILIKKDQCLLQNMPKGLNHHHILYGKSMSRRKAEKKNIKGPLESLTASLTFNPTPNVDNPTAPINIYPGTAAIGETRTPDIHSSALPTFPAKAAR